MNNPGEQPQLIERFKQIPERNSVDVLLRTAQQHHVALSSMADTKANIIITVSSIVLTLSLGKMSDASLRLSMLTLIFFSLAALLLAILAVLPKYRPLKIDDIAIPENFNLIFFGHFATLSRKHFLTEFAKTLESSGISYLTLANDVYSLGSYLARHKYRYLRWSYLCFLLGFILASLEQFGFLLLRP